MAARRLEKDPTSARARDDSFLELVDVPAAVVCAHCGSPTCMGCLGAEEPTQGSGVVAIVPWERPKMALWPRFWHTAKLATLESQPFFTALPDGPVPAALSFAILAEVLAVTSVVAVTAILALAAVPGLPAMLVADPALLHWALSGVAWIIPGLSGAMVGLHALHGLCLDSAARRLGSTRKKSRGLRFGLYACAWDFVTLPMGWMALLFGSGLSVAARAIPLALNVPGRAARAYLRGFHRLDENTARRASRQAVAVSGAVALAVSLALAAAYVALVLFG